MNFSLNEAQQKKLQSWKDGQLSKDKTRDATGFRFTYSFTPTTLGTYVKVLDNATKEELDLTDDNW